MLIVDVFNVIHAADKGGAVLGRVDLDRLFALVGSGRFAGQAVWLVCDGTAGGRAARGDLPTGVGDRRGGSGVRVLFAGPGKDADALIESLLDQLEHSGRAHAATVVSSDRRVQVAATGARARFMSSQEFLGALADDARRAAMNDHRRTGGKPEFASGPGLDKDSAAAWMKEFGIESDAESSRGGGDAKVHWADGSLSGSEGKPEPGEVFDERTLRELEEWARRQADDDGR